MTSQKIELAKKYCQHYHEGQFRKGSNLPYTTHPFSVAETLARYGYDDVGTQCMAYLHHTVPTEGGSVEKQEASSMTHAEIEYVSQS